MHPKLSRAQILSNLAAIPDCIGLEEQPSASIEREKLQTVLTTQSSSTTEIDGIQLDDTRILLALSTPLGLHIAHGLAYTIGSALGCVPPSVEECLVAFTTTNRVNLTAGARAWSKHAHRSFVESDSQALQSSQSDAGNRNAITEQQQKIPKQRKPPPPMGWWGTPSGPVATINENALRLFWNIIGNASWRNLHWLPHSVLVYEVRVKMGYGMRWSQDRSQLDQGMQSRPPVVQIIDTLRRSDDGSDEEVAGGRANVMNMNDKGDADDGLGTDHPPWIFRGFVEPMMENGHEKGWRHAP
ncbi:MAG: hypothetical protein NXY57DRAFT_280268 [Lentinula lateritia]|uniref:Uncharacterized protein n=1 Tax=Lentinula lateritia TaxID=40482 RepID=A0ABQ8VXR7_9AGAR|nr:MAG: hypothetical protein NXY57DRAFT_280268 [Lentinula lateritia]KAJ4501182.1 hypothetical protein C8R41DRAFT_190613 [Lentinula lateritia]